MAIEEMKKIHLVGHQHIKARVVQLLQRLGIVEIIKIKEKGQEPEVFPSEQGAELEERLSQINRVVKFLEGYEKIGFLKGLWESFLPAKAYFQKEEARHIQRTFSEVEAFNIYKNLEEKIDLIKIKREQLKEEEKGLLPYRQFPLAKEDLMSGQTVDTTFGIIPKKHFLEIAPALKKKYKGIWFETFQKDAKTLFLVIVCLKGEKARITQFLSALNFQFGIFSKRQKASCQERLKEIGKELNLLDLNEQKIDKEIQALAFEKNKLLLLHDTLSSQLKQRYINRNFSQTKAVFILEGWIKNSEVKILREKVIKIFPELEIAVVPVPADSQPPIAFKNRAWLKPFEFITRLYGAPRYSSFDPTPFLAPFFALFFGLCIADAGYGLILLVLGWWILKKMRLEVGQKLIFRLLIFCGFLTVLLGLLMGSIFCLDFDNLPRMLGFLQGFRRKVMLFDPLENIMLFLGICLTLGVIQIYFGILLKIIMQVKRRKFIEAFLQEAPWIFFLTGLILWIGVYIGGLTEAVLPLAKIFSLAGGGIIFFFAGYGTKNIFLRLGKGLFKLYGTVGMLGDVLSYSRLLALGLATTVIGMAVNIIADLFSQIPVVGFFVGLLVILLGHSFNIFINSLGGFAHTLRLQFVEFFTKFYEGGGDFFEPFRLENKFSEVGK